VIAEFPTSGL